MAKAARTPAGLPDPTGNVTFNLYAGLTCTGSPTAETVALASDGTAESSTTTVAADLSYHAVYSGDANYTGHTGACEPLAANVTVPCPAGSFKFKLEANGDLSQVRPVPGRERGGELVGGFAADVEHDVMC